MTYVVIEGVDGSGKTSLAQALVARFDGKAAYMTEPSKRPGSVGAEIRRRMVNGPRLEPWESLGMFVADRRAQLEFELRPALEAGAVVVQDRNWLSTAVYQGNWSEGAPQAGGPVWPTGDWIAHAHVRFMPPPDLLILLDLPGKVAIERVRERSRTLDQFEKTAADEVEARRARYSRLVKTHQGPEWWGTSVVLDATRSKADIADAAWDLVAACEAKRQATA